MSDYASVSNLNDDLVLKALTGSLFVAPITTAALTTTNLFAVGGALAALPNGYTDGGLITDDGIRTARAVTTADTSAWQSLEPVRSDKTSDSETLQVDFEETNRQTIELFTGADLSAVATVHGAISIQKPALPTDRFYRLLALAVDVVDGEELYIARFYPRAKVSETANQAFAKGSSLQWGMTFKTFVDPVLGYSKDDMIGGPGFATLRDAMGFTPLP